ncbi:MAG TPA: hypothetical protein VK586_25065 [Streptosporangiaceae bacterium]|nr:hypothetical protein [Streptosporangiaceae bacterium]
MPGAPPGDIPGGDRWCQILPGAMGPGPSFLTRSTRGTLHELVLIRPAGIGPLECYGWCRW